MNWGSSIPGLLVRVLSLGGCLFYIPEVDVYMTIKIDCIEA